MMMQEVDRLICLTPAFGTRRPRYNNNDKVSVMHLYRLDLRSATSGIGATLATNVQLNVDSNYVEHVSFNASNQDGTR